MIVRSCDRVLPIKLRHVLHLLTAMPAMHGEAVYNLDIPRVGVRGASAGQRSKRGQVEKEIGHHRVLLQSGPANTLALKTAAASGRWTAQGMRTCMTPIAHVPTCCLDIICTDRCCSVRQCVEWQGRSAHATGAVEIHM